jgi:hypothetical protein
MSQGMSSLAFGSLGPILANMQQNRYKISDHNEQNSCQLNSLHFLKNVSFNRCNFKMHHVDVKL